MAKAIRLADIAERLGVSTVTVSKALADKEGVSDQLRVKIKTLALEMGYKQSGNSKSTRDSNAHNVGILIAERFLGNSPSFYWKLYRNLVIQLTQNGLYGILEILKPEMEEDHLLPQMIQDEKIDGLIIVGQVKDSYLDFICNFNIPTMFLDFYNEQNRTDCVISDGYYGMYQMTNYLIENGHKNIAFVGSLLATSSITDRYFGYARALMEHGIEIREDWIIEDRDSAGQFDLKLPKKLPTAFACNCDLIAYELINKLAEQGYSVPDDISIVGFDNYLYSDLANPAITTYEVDMEGMAKECVAAIAKKIKNKDYKSRIKIVTGHLMIKNSVRDINETVTLDKDH